MASDFSEVGKTRDGYVRDVFVSLVFAEIRDGLQIFSDECRLNLNSCSEFRNEKNW